MASLHKFKLLATQCAVASSPTRSPTASPVIHIRRRKTLRMLLNCNSSRRRLHGCEESSDCDETVEESPERNIGNEKTLSARGKLKDLFVSSPPLDDIGVNSYKVRNDDREGLLGDTRNIGRRNDGGLVRRRGSAGLLRPISARFRYRLLRRAWQPMLVTIPEKSPEL